MPKGITPIIAIILLLLITISMVGFAFVWFSRVATISAERTENLTAEQTSIAAKTIRIDNAIAASVTIRNTGIASINISRELAVFVDDAIRSWTTINPNCASLANILAPGSIRTCEFSTPACTAGSGKVKVTAPGNTDVVTCG